MAKYSKRSTRSRRYAKKSTSRYSMKKTKWSRTGKTKVSRIKKNYRNRIYGIAKSARTITAPKVQVKLNYWDQLTLIAGGTANYAEYLLSLNGLFDPNESATGHQPRGFDQWKNFYNMYIVKGVQYDVTLRYSSTESGTDIAVVGMAGVHFGDGLDYTDYGSIVEFMENPSDLYEKRKHWSSGSSTAREVATVYGQTKFKGYISNKKIAHIQQPEKLWPKDYVTDVSTNPTTGLSQTMIVWTAALAQGTGAVGVSETNLLPLVLIEVLMTYYVEFSDPIYLGAS